MKKGIKRVLLGMLLISPTLLFGQVSNAYADSTINAFNRIFITTYNNFTTYRNAINKPGTNDGTWTLAIDIQGMLDAYERTGHRCAANYCNAHVCDAKVARFGISISILYCCVQGLIGPEPSCHPGSRGREETTSG